MNDSHVPGKDENIPVEFTHTLPGKRMASGALFFNARQKILIVKPTYREGWLVPGGVIERDESPYQACLREIREELGLNLSLQRLLCFEYRPAYDLKSESIHFMFYGGVLDESTIQTINLPQDELSACRFCERAEAMELLLPALSARMKFALMALDQQRVIYLENQVEVLKDGN